MKTEAEVREAREALLTWIKKHPDLTGDRTRVAANCLSWVLGEDGATRTARQMDEALALVRGINAEA